MRFNGNILVGRKIIVLPSGRVFSRVAPVLLIRKKISLLALIILALTAHWLLSFFGQSIVPGISHTGGFIDMLSVIIVVLIIVEFLL